MVDLTDEQKDECEKIMNSLVSYWWRKLKVRMDAGLTFDDALAVIMAEIVHD